MEHRYHERLPVALDVEVRHRGVALGRFKTRDICPEGLSLAIDPQVGIKGHEVLELRIHSPLCAPFESRGWVIHRGHRVAGIMFLNHDSRCMKLISEFGGERVA